MELQSMPYLETFDSTLRFVRLPLQSFHVEIANIAIYSEIGFGSPGLVVRPEIRPMGFMVKMRI